MLRRRLVALLLLAGSIAPAAAQPAADEPPAAEFGETIEVSLVQLEAIVTDDRGRRVRGLGASDFRLKVDGVETPIALVAEIDERSRGSRPTSAADSTVEPKETRPAVAPTWQSRNVLVLLDDSTMVEARRDYVVDKLRRQLDSLSPGDRAAVVAFTGEQLELLCGWTSDRKTLRAALDTAVARPAIGIKFEVKKREEASDAALVAAAAELGDEPPKDAAAAGGKMQPAVVAPPVFDVLGRYRSVAAAASGAMRLLRPPSGRRMLLLYSEGFVMAFLGSPVIEAAGRLGYSVYPVDVRGLDTTWASNDAELERPQRGTGFVTTEADRQSDFALEWIAGATGGKASLNSNRIRALDRLVEDSASYYVVGFSPSRGTGIREHRIELAAVRPGVEVRTRDRWIEPDPPAAR